MLNYKDMTFCPYWKDCRDARECHRPLTKDVEAKAKQADMLISVFAEKPDCHRPKYNKNGFYTYERDGK